MGVVVRASAGVFLFFFFFSSFRVFPGVEADLICGAAK